MGSSELASAPAEGKRCLLRVTCTQDKSSTSSVRMIEWNKDWSSFKDMEAKVRLMFSIREKEKLKYTYTHHYGRICMSTDEELATALSLVGQDNTLQVIVEKQYRRKSKLCRLVNTAKAYKPQVVALLAGAKDRISACAGVAMSRVRSSGRAVASKFTCPYARANGPASENNNNSDAAPNANSNAQASPNPPRPCRGMRKHIGLTVFFLVLAAAICMNVCHHNKMLRHYHSHQYTHHFTQYMEQANMYKPRMPAFNDHRPSAEISIVGATYGGQDVTQQLQKYYNKNGVVMSSNTVFGDPAYGVQKYLHVVYSVKAHGDMKFSQAFVESEEPQLVSMNYPACGEARMTLVDGQYVQIFGVLSGDQDLTCQVRNNLQITGTWNNGNNIPATGSPYTVIYTKLSPKDVSRGRTGRVFALTSMPGHHTAL